MNEHICRVGRLRPLQAWKNALAVLLLALFSISAWAASAPNLPPNTVRLHYHRHDGNLAGWSIYVWTGAATPSPGWDQPTPATGSTTFGVFFDVPLATGATKLNYILRNADGSLKNCGSDGELDVATHGHEIWHLQDDCKVYTAGPDTPRPANTARIHLHRNAHDYGGWSLYTWTGAANPSPAWDKPQAANGADTFGVFFDVALQAGAAKLNYIVRNADGSVKNCGTDQELVTASGYEAWHLQDDCTGYLTRPAIVVRIGDLTKAKAHWVKGNLLAWKDVPAGDSYRLHYAPNGGLATGSSGVTGPGAQSLALSVDPAGLPAEVLAKFPHLQGYTALKLAAADVAGIDAVLQGQVAVGRYQGSQLADATELQIAGVLDDRYGGAAAERLGAYVNPEAASQGDPGLGQIIRPPISEALVRAGKGLMFKLWAPTARKVRLLLYPQAEGGAEYAVDMTRNANGVWSAVSGHRHWANAVYYRYEVTVYSRATGKVEVQRVTDPYSLGLAVNGTRSLMVDLDRAETQPAGWPGLRMPALAAPEDAAIYELHVRDFSMADPLVPAPLRGKFAAFGLPISAGTLHLRTLAQSGLTHVHLLPSFDIASVPERGAKTPALPADAGPGSTRQQEAIQAVKDEDGFNWGYDPHHYTVPEGSYATDPNGVARIREFRGMVQALARMGLRTVMDVVYNHTHAAGNAPSAVLDKIVPGYYHRLDDHGGIATSTCCSNTATEHVMMEKLMLDSLAVWAKHYQVKGFRFDLMGHHMKSNMLKVRALLDGIDPSIIVYGEGWNFGEVGNNARGVNATQFNMAGTGVGTFSDRGRDAVRGGGPFDNKEALIARQGFINGLYYDPNSLGGTGDAAKRDLLGGKDLIRLMIAGTLADYPLTDRDGQPRKGSELDYNGQPAGYTKDPQEVINYVSAHDNQTLFDINQYKLPVTTPLADRVRVNTLGVALVALSQGIPFFHAGDELLRSKSLDRDSYNSGDWFNRLDFTYQSNNWGVGLPPEGPNADNWPLMKPLLENPALKPKSADILRAHLQFAEFLAIRKSSPLFRLRSAEDIKARLKFHDLGPNQVPGLIAWSISDQVGVNLDPVAKSVVVVVNADKSAQSVTVTDYARRSLSLHPYQLLGSDDVVRGARFEAATGRFTIPARTVSVWIER